MNYRNFLSSIPLREDILNDITYLQKQLRIIIKFHQKCSTKLLFVSPADSNGIQGTTIRSTNFAAVRKFMDELERELDDISNEQKMLTDILKNCLKIHLKTIKQKSNIEVDSEDANGYIANSIQAHYEKYYVTIQPHNVKTRIPEELLKKKYDELRSQSASEKPFLQLPPPTTSVNKKPIIPQHQQQSKSKQESLLKPKFRKPSAVPTLVKNPLAKVHKKTANKVISVSGIKQVCDTKGKYKTVQNQIKVNNQAITHSRLNLLRALSNVKTEVTDNKEELNKFYTEKCRAIKLERSDESCSDQSSYDDVVIDEPPQQVDPLRLRAGPGRKRKSPAVHSEDSSDSDLMKNFPPLPIEPPPKMDYTQEEFLDIFKLITPDVAEKLKLRRSERKRRNCAKNERTDYHYGNFDLNEAAYRVRLNQNKRSILYSPNRRPTQK